MKTKTEYEVAAIDVTDEERDLIIQSLSRVGRTITVHSQDKVRAAHALLAKFGYMPDGTPATEVLPEGETLYPVRNNGGAARESRGTA